MNTATTIAFIGAGNMAQCLIHGLIADGFAPNHIWATRRDVTHLAELQQLGVRVISDNVTAVQNADIVVLGIKPDKVHAIADEIFDAVCAKRPLVISVAAGISTELLTKWLGAQTPIVRAMPNTPAQLRCGVTGLYATEHVNEPARTLAQNIFSSVGACVWLDQEASMDALTAVSGCGPAYFFLVMEAIEKAACELGLSAQDAQLLTLQTALGAAQLAAHSQKTPAQLRRQVTSPNGVTERAIHALESGGLIELFNQALHAAVTRSRELTSTLENS